LAAASQADGHAEKNRRNSKKALTKKFSNIHLMREKGGDDVMAKKKKKAKKKTTKRR
jgi:hypothetical protein